MEILHGQFSHTNMKKVSEELKSITPSVSQMVEKSLANYINQQGIQKFYSLFEVTENLKQFMIITYGEDWLIKKVNEELAKSKLIKLQDYEQLDKFLKKARKKINEAQIVYDTNKNKRENIKKNFEVLISKKISPYQIELHFLFNLMLSLTPFSNKVISRELLRSAEEGKLNQNQFKKEK